jgi:hypothetical protein
MCNYKNKANHKKFQQVEGLGSKATPEREKRQKTFEAQKNSPTCK